MADEITSADSPKRDFLSEWDEARYAREDAVRERLIEREDANRAEDIAIRRADALRWSRGAAVQAAAFYMQEQYLRAADPTKALLAMALRLAEYIETGD